MNKFSTTFIAFCLVSMLRSIVFFNGSAQQTNENIFSGREGKTSIIEKTIKNATKISLFDNMYTGFDDQIKIDNGAIGTDNYQTYSMLLDVYDLLNKKIPKYILTNFLIGFTKFYDHKTLNTTEKFVYNTEDVITILDFEKLKDGLNILQYNILNDYTEEYIEYIRKNVLDKNLSLFNENMQMFKNQSNLKMKASDLNAVVQMLFIDYINELRLKNEEKKSEEIKISKRYNLFTTKDQSESVTTKVMAQDDKNKIYIDALTTYVYKDTENLVKAVGLENLKIFFNLEKAKKIGYTEDEFNEICQKLYEEFAESKYDVYKGKAESHFKELISTDAVLKEKTVYMIVQLSDKKVTEFVYKWAYYTYQENLHSKIKRIIGGRDIKMVIDDYEE